MSTDELSNTGAGPDPVSLITDDMKARLKQLADRDFDAFLRLMGADTLQIFICYEREKELSINQISVKLRAAGVQLARSALGDRCKKCP